MAYPSAAYLRKRCTSAALCRNNCFQAGPAEAYTFLLAEGIALVQVCDTYWETQRGGKQNKKNKKERHFAYKAMFVMIYS